MSKEEHTASEQAWRVWVDTGGTFTDCLAQAPDGGEARRAKVLSSGRLRARVVRADRAGDELTLIISAGWLRALPPAWLHGAQVLLLPDRAALGAVAGCAPHAESNGEPCVAITLANAGQESLAAELNVGATLELDPDLEAPVLAAHLVTRTPLAEALPAMHMRLATTRGTNALLERKGDRVALFLSQGFADLLAIGNQQRPDLFALQIPARQQWQEAVVEIPGRLDAQGQEIAPLDLDAIAEQARQLKAQGITSAAIALMHSYRNPAHEERVEALLRKIGFTHISASSALAPTIKILERAQTAVVDAYLGPVVQRYLGRVAERCAGGSLRVMTSAGGLQNATEYHAKDSLLCGPAGGVAGAARAALASGIERVLTFDMGGTSTDVARYAGDFEYVYEHAVGEARVAAPAVAIESVAAGGGSICSVFRGELRVGPESAGSSPGPACYGAGGPLTLTDINLLAGRLRAERFGVPVDRDAAEKALLAVQRQLASHGREMPREALLEALLSIADERMADAIRSISLRKGYAPGDHALVAFGGAGGLHACAIAELLGVNDVLIPADAGLLSASGVGHAQLEAIHDLNVLKPLTAHADDELREWISQAAERALVTLIEQAPEEAADAQVQRILLEVRLQGQDSALEVAVNPQALDQLEAASLLQSFEQQYRERYGHWPHDRAVELVSLRAVARAGERSSVKPAEADTSHAPPAHPNTQPSRVLVDGEWQTGTLLERGDLRPGACVPGPALIVEDHATTWLADGWTLTVDSAGALRMQRDTSPTHASAASSQAKAEAQASDQPPRGVELELTTHRLTAIAREMGEMLRRCALSTNIKERMDFSCAVLNPRGELVVNAPHIPVHLGALGECVRTLMQHEEMQPGDAWVTNHPAFGGSHLPDVTLISPVHDDAGELLAFVASRAHHAELGGKVPGSMPPDASRLIEEGVVIPPIRVCRKGEADWQGLRDQLSGGAFPSRAVGDNITDLEAALAANRQGEKALREHASSLGPGKLVRLMEAIADHAESRLRYALQALPGGEYSATELLDDGTPLAVRARIDKASLRISFAGSGDQHPGNLNATPAIVRSAVMYVLRLLVREDLPLNEGIMRVVELGLPPGLLNPEFPEDPADCPAVVGGNVETSQRLVDALLRAFGLLAGSQGTMNNVIFGNDRFSYYETVAGGSGAGDGFDGADAVQIHMTNTRMTDSEVLEHRFPVRVERFALRDASGGTGKWRGGKGVVRHLRFLQPVDLSLMAQHRVQAPYGMEGGGTGALGEQDLIRADGGRQVLGGNASVRVAAGDCLILRTPGGGGWGKA